MSIIHYKMKDNLNDARGMFGWSFGMSPHSPSINVANDKWLQEDQPKFYIVSPHPCWPNEDSRRDLYPLSRMQELHLPTTTYAFEFDHTFRQECRFP